MEPVTLSLKHLHKTYPNGVKAVSDVFLTVEPGTIFGLIGPNGAGKSTLLLLASGLLTPDSGQVFCNQNDVTAHPQNAASFVGLMPDPLGVYTDLSAIEYLDFFSRVLEIPEKEAKSRINEVVGLLEFEPWLDAEVETLSAGWQRRLALGRVLLSQAPVLLLDEPAAGLDISARHDLLDIIRKLAQKNHTIVISSHILPELEELADYFGVLKQGTWVEIRPQKIFFSRNEFNDSREKTRWRLECSDPVQARATIDTLDAEVVEMISNGLVFSASDEHEAATVLQHVVHDGIEVYSFSREQLELNSVVRKLLEGNGS